MQIFHFATEALELYYQRKLLSVAHNRVDHYVSLKFLGKNAMKITKDAITPLQNDLFLVHSKREVDTEYLVDMSLGTCSCPAGRDGSPCSHQHAGILHYQKASLNYIPTMHPAARQKLAYIALGDKVEKRLQFYTYYTECKPKNKKRGRPGNEASLRIRNLTLYLTSRGKSFGGGYENINLGYSQDQCCS